MHDLLSPKQRRVLLGILVFTVLVRLLTLGAYPLADTTEARYAEIGRKMAETGNWVTPLEDYGVPFWAKPPLSTWLTAITFLIFGVNEFAARLSPLFLMAAVCWLTWLMALRQRGRDRALVTVVVLATTALTFITAGAVMTDGAVALSSTLCMVAFWLALSEKGRVWGYLFFVGLGLGLLSKGLVPIVLTMFPIVLWVAWKNQWATVLRRLPWVSGTVLAVAVAAPWYILAEMRTPGFLKYFFIGEHFGKFLDKGWSGDRYGTAHGAPRGTIWLYWLAAALPWSVAMISLYVRRKLRPRPSDPQVPGDPWFAYLLVWTLAPMLFFTFAGNIMLTYVMPGLPAFALLAAEFLLPAAGNAQAPSAERRSGSLLPLLSLVVPLLFAVIMSTVGPRMVGERSEKAAVAKYEELRTGTDSRLIYFFYKPHSAKFYTRGKVIEVDLNTVAPYLNDGIQDFFAVRHGNIALLPQAMLDRLEPVWKDREIVLYRERMDRPAPAR